MSLFVAFHLGLHCLQKYSFRSFSNTEGLGLLCFTTISTKNWTVIYILAATICFNVMALVIMLGFFLFVVAVFAPPPSNRTT